MHCQAKFKTQDSESDSTSRQWLTLSHLLVDIYINFGIQQVNEYVTFVDIALFHLK